MLKHETLFEKGKKNGPSKKSKKSGMAMGASLTCLSILTAFFSGWKVACDDELCMDTFIGEENITMEQARHALPTKFGFEPMPLYERIPWTKWAQWNRVLI